jgi:hypothetical protein
MKKLGALGQGELLRIDEIKREDTNVVRTPFRITLELKRSLTLRLLDEGYGIKGKSRWIVEAVQLIIEDHRYKSTNIYKAQILEFASTRQANGSDSVNLPYTTWVHAWHAMLDTMKYGASLEPPEFVEVTVSDVLHIAILNRLQMCAAHR